MRSEPVNADVLRKPVDADVLREVDDDSIVV